MAWNLPNDQKPPKSKEPTDPWTARPSKKTDADQPPHLETLIRDAWLKTKRQWGKGTAPRPRTWVISVAGVLVALWLGLSLYYVNANQLAYVMRLGVYQGQLTPGWQWRAWGLYRVAMIPQPLHVMVNDEVMTQDLNLTKVDVNFSYQIMDPQAYLFRMKAPQAAMQAFAHAAVQQAVGDVDLAVLLSEKNPPVLIAHLKTVMQGLVDQAGLGVKIETVAINDVAIPDTLQELFDKMNALYLIQATEKQKNAEYQQKVLPPAIEQARAWQAAAETYGQQAQLKARADVADFLALLPSYEKNPQLIKYQLYTQTMTAILSESSSVVVDGKGSTPTVVVNTPAPSPVAPANRDAAPTDLPTSQEESPANPSNDYGNVKGGYG